MAPRCHSPKGVHRDVSRISNDRCRVLLDQYLSAGYRLRPLYFALDDHEFRATVEDAILEAAITHDAGQSREGTWVRRVLRWRLDEASAAAAEARACDQLGEVAAPVDPEHALLQASALQAVERLSPRFQVVIAARLEGDTYDELGQALSLSRPHAHRQTKKALRALRQHMEGAACG
jgi:DNA-directed RNA polymerase specialized sigma24 family protein